MRSDTVTARVCAAGLSVLVLACQDSALTSVQLRVAYELSSTSAVIELQGTYEADGRAAFATQRYPRTFEAPGAREDSLTILFPDDRAGSTVLLEATLESPEGVVTSTGTARVALVQGASVDALIVLGSSGGAVCGNGVIDAPTEACDDFNPVAGDGCGSTCQIELGWACSEEPSRCIEWWRPAWSKRRPLYLNGANVRAPASDVPVLVLLDPQRIDYGATRDGGEDLRFVAADHATVLPHEIDRWNNGGQSHVWVRVPEVATDSSSRIYMYYGAANTGVAPDPTQAWTDGFEAVWHLGGGPVPGALEVKDSTANGHDGMLLGGMSASNRVAGRIAGGISFDGVDDAIDTGGFESNDWTGLTLEAWVRPRSSANFDDRIVCKSRGTALSDHSFCLLAGNGGGAVRVTTDGAAGGAFAATTTEVLSGRWSYVVGTWSAGGSLRYYVNGVSVAEVMTTGDTVLDSMRSVIIGNVNLIDFRYFDGNLDEVRIARVERSPEWIALQLDSMVDRLINFGPEEERPQ